MFGSSFACKILHKFCNMFIASNQWCVRHSFCCSGHLNFVLLFEIMSFKNLKNSCTYFTVRHYTYIDERASLSSSCFNDTSFSWCSHEIRTPWNYLVYIGVEQIKFCNTKRIELKSKTAQSNKCNRLYNASYFEGTIYKHLGTNKISRSDVMVNSLPRVSKTLQRDKQSITSFFQCSN